MAEPTENFEPEKINVDTLEDAKRKIWELHNDIKKKGEKHAQKETEYNEKFETLNNEINELKEERRLSRQKEKEKAEALLKEQGSYKELFETLQSEKQQVESSLSELQTKLKGFEIEEEKRQLELKQKRENLLNQIEDENLRQLLMDSKIELIEREVGLQGKRNPVNSQLQPTVEGAGEIPAFKSQLLNQDPKDSIIEKQVKAIFK